MFTVRRIVQGEGVERKFPLHSPKIAKIEVKRSGIVRRAKLYFLRDRIGKAVRLRRRRGEKAPSRAGRRAVPLEPARRKVAMSIGRSIFNSELLTCGASCYALASRDFCVVAQYRQPKPLGYLGERAAEKHLQAQGLQDRRPRLAIAGGGRVGPGGRRRPHGRLRRSENSPQSHDAGHPAEAVDRRQAKAADPRRLAYLKRHDLLECTARDSTSWPSPGPPTSKRPTIEHFQNAFEAVGRGQMFS